MSRSSGISWLSLTRRGLLLLVLLQSPFFLSYADDSTAGGATTVSPADVAKAPDAAGATAAQKPTDGVEHSAPVAAATAAAASNAAAAAPAAADAARLASPSGSAASAIMAAAAGPVASLPRTAGQQQQQDVAAAKEAANNAEKAATAAAAAAAAAGAISAGLLQVAAPAAAPAPQLPAAADKEAPQLKGNEQQQGDVHEANEGDRSFIGILASPLSALPEALGQRLKAAVRIAAVAAAVIMQLTPLPTIARSTMGMESLPFFTLLFSASLWLLYGALRVEPTILLPNFSGVIAGGWFVLTFWANTSRDDKQRFLLALYLKVGAIIFVVLLSICVCCPFDFAELVVGLVASIVNVISYASPLAALRVVLKERSTALMPAEVSIGNFVCSALWLAYGWIAEDVFIIVPNFLGFGVGAAQLLLLAVIPPPSRQGFSAVCSSSSSSSWRRSPASCVSGSPGGPAFIRRADDYCWGGQDSYFSDDTTASTLTLKASVCANAPSLPTHDELLKQCGFEKDPEAVYGFGDDLLS